MKSDKMRIGLWGVGRHAERRLLPAFRGCENAMLSSVHTRDIEIGGRISEQFDCVYHADVSEFLEDPNIDAVVICTPTGLHHSHALRALSSGKHILVEKPFTHSGKTTVELYALAHQKNLIVMDGLMYLFHPQFQGLVDTVESGSLGSIRSVSIRFGLPGVTANTFRSQRELGGGASLDMLCYPLSLAYQICTTPPTLVASEVIQSRNSDVDSGGWCILRSGGLLLDAHWGTELAYKNDLSIWGSNRSLHCQRIFTKEPSYKSQVQFFDSGGAKEKIFKTGSADAYSLMLDKFASDIKVSRHDLEAEKASIWCAEMTSAIMG